MSSFAYPDSLLAALRAEESRLASMPKKSAWPPAITLPSDSVLAHLLDVAYHATFLREEGRPLTFQIVFCTPNEMAKDRFGADRPLIKFEKPHDLTTQNLRRLALATSVEQSAIAVQSLPTEGPVPHLGIWGIVLADPRATLLGGDGIPLIEPLPALILRCFEPGFLLARWGNLTLARLKDGAIVRRIEDVLEFEPLGSFFTAAAKQMYEKVYGAKLAQADAETQKHVKSAAWDMYIRCLKSLLGQSRKKSHGGTIVMVSSGLRETCTTSTNLRIKYRCSSFPIWGHILAALKSEVAHWRTGLAETLGDELLARQQEVEAWHRVVDREIDAIADLTAVDGAVIITDRFELLGFGAEVQIESDAQSILIAPTQGVTGRSESIESYGTRHRSAFRFCERFPDSVVFILSQDGGIKAVRNVNGKVSLWPTIFP